MASPDAARTLEHSASRELDSHSDSKPDAPNTNGSERGTHEKKILWKQLLAGASPREVLARIMNGDPLELRPRVVARIRDRAWLIDVDRVLLRSFARTARFAVRYRGDPPLELWLGERIDEALADILREDLEAERRVEPIDVHQHAAFVALAKPLGLDPARVRAACAAFNAQADDDRRTFYALVIEGRALDELARARSQSASEVGRTARRVLDRLLEAAAPNPSSAVAEETRR